MGKEFPNLEELLSNDVFTNINVSLYSINSVKRTIINTTDGTKVNDDMVQILRTCENYLLLVSEVLNRSVREEEYDADTDTETIDVPTEANAEGAADTQ